MALGALGQLAGYDGGVQAVSDVSLSSSEYDTGSRAPQETVFRNASSSVASVVRLSSTRCA